MGERLTPDVRRRLRMLAATLPMLEAPDFVPGRWHDSERNRDGSWSMPWYELAPATDRFSEGTLDHAFESGLIVAIVRRARSLAESQVACRGHSDARGSTGQEG